MRETISHALKIAMFSGAAFLASPESSLGQGAAGATPLESSCVQALSLFAKGTPIANKKGHICQQVVQRDKCQSIKGKPIFHYERLSSQERARRILVFGLIHGDELQSGAAASSWISRLSAIDPRNSWRIVPVLNPDGLQKRSRVNANGIDLNRNFPTRDWTASAVDYWRKFTKKDPRRNPGTSPASEIETQCAVAHIEEFKPDFIVAIHTPYGALDLDGPKDLALPKTGLPWVSLGHYPGSLGRFMWHDQNLPVLTIELTGLSNTRFEDLDKLQDLSSVIATKAVGAIRQSKPLEMF